MRQQIKHIPGAALPLAAVGRFVRRYTFSGSQHYWERHYTRGSTSGEGSVGPLARFKADVLNELVARHAVTSVIEFGCGDGQQLALAKYPRRLGLDVSPTTLRRTMGRFAGDPTKSFLRYDPACFADPAGLVSADLAISLDVIYHLVEDDVYRLQLEHVFGAARRLVVLYTSDLETLTVAERSAPHVRHRPVMRDIAQRFPEWRLRERVPNRYPYRGAGTPISFADFFIYAPAREAAGTRWPEAETCAASVE